jgi:hypothetical protein
MKFKNTFLKNIFLLGFGLSLCFASVNAKAKVLKNSKVPLMDLAMALKPEKGYGEIVSGMKLASNIYLAVQNSKKIYGFKPNALKTIIANDADSVMNLFADLKSGAKVITEDIKINSVVLDAATEKVLLAVLLDYLLVTNKKFFNCIYSKLYKPYLKVSFEESLKEKLGEDGLAKSILFKSLGETPASIEEFFRKEISSTSELFVVMRDLMAFMQDMIISVPQARASYIKYAKKEAIKNKAQETTTAAA